LKACGVWLAQTDGGGHPDHIVLGLGLQLSWRSDSCWLCYHCACAETALIATEFSEPKKSHLDTSIFRWTAEKHVTFLYPIYLLDKRRNKFQSNALVYCIILASRHNVLMYLS